MDEERRTRDARQLLTEEESLLEADHCVVDVPPMLIFGWIAWSAWVAFQFSWYRRARVPVSIPDLALANSDPVEPEMKHEQAEAEMSFEPARSESAASDLSLDSSAMSESD